MSLTLTSDRAGDPPSAAAPDAGREGRTRLEAVYRAELAWVYRTVLRLGARERDAEDLTQEVFLAFHRTIASYDPTRPLRPWLFGVAFRVVSDYRRRARFTRETPEHRLEAVATREPAHDPASELARREDRRLVLAALDCLPMDQRAVFVAVELDEEAVPEVASALQIPLNTAYSRLRLARGRFAQAVQRLRHETPRGGTP